MINEILSQLTTVKNENKIQVQKLWTDAKALQLTTYILDSNICMKTLTN